MRALVCYVSVAAGLALGVPGTGLMGTAVAAEPSSVQKTGGLQTAFMRMYGPSQAPYGFVRYCEASPENCAPAGTAEQRLQPTPSSLSELDEVNRSVNAEIEPATDAEIYGVSEYWTIPAKRGDCEDYALLKQQKLIERGWPSSALLITVVRDERGEGHAVLTARTSQGDYILDNKIDVVRMWNRSGYQFVMRQSYIDPKVWVSLDPASSTPPAAIAGVGGLE